MLILPIVLAGCASGGEDTVAEPPVRVGPTQQAVPSSEQPQASHSTVAAPPSTALVGASRSQAGPANQTTLDHPTGLRLILTVSGRLRYSADSDLVFSLVVRNMGRAPVRYDSNQDLSFAMYADGHSEPAWTDRTCDWKLRYGAPPQTGPLQLEPGEEVSFVEEYPVGPGGRNVDVGPDPDSCRVPPGRYRVVGFVDHCPDAAIRHSEHNGMPYCERSAVDRIASRPLTIEIVG